jgi:hypothetical protein
MVYIIIVVFTVFIVSTDGARFSGFFFFFSSFRFCHSSARAAAQANIQGPAEVYVKKGSTISLTCSVNVHSTPPSSVVWLQGTKVVDFDSPRGRGGISLETEKTESGTTSRLLVTKAGLSDTGNYTCQPSNANTATVFVHVLNGEFNARVHLIKRTS